MKYIKHLHALRILLKNMFSNTLSYCFILSLLIAFLPAGQNELLASGSYDGYAGISTGIMPFFDYSENSTSGKNSDIVLSGLSDRLSKYKFINLVERSKLKDVMKEVELGQTGLVDDNTAVKIGKIHGLQVMVTGTIHPDKIYARAIHMETQKVIGSYSVQNISEINTLGAELASGIEVFLARENLKSMRNDSPDIDLDFRVEGVSGSGKVAIGKNVEFMFKSNRDGFLTIVDIQPGGDVVILYPNELHPSNIIKAGDEYSVPSAEDSFKIQVYEPAGEDTIVVFFTKRKVDWLDRKKLTGQGFRKVKEHEKFAVSRGFRIAATKLKPADWESRAVVIDVIKP